MKKVVEKARKWGEKVKEIERGGKGRRKKIGRVVTYLQEDKTIFKILVETIDKRVNPK